MVGGLRAIQRVAAAHELGKFSGCFHTLAYVGFLAPFAVAVAARWGEGIWIMGTMMLLAMVSITLIAANTRKFLPHQPKRTQPMPDPAAASKSGYLSAHKESLPEGWPT